MATIISHSPSQTAEIGEEWGRQAQSGWLVGLSGGLGAGKTLLAAGIARGLGITGRVPSPTFALVHEYREGRLPFFHLDLYRLNTRAEIIGAGLEEYLTRPAGVAVVEWIERWLETPPAPVARGVFFRRVQIKTTGGTAREISYEDIGG